MAFCSILLTVFAFAAQVILPPGNLLPKSWYLVKHVLALPDIDKYEYHACTCDKHCYEKIERSEWEAHADDQCPHCHTRRFTRGRNGKLKPVKVKRSY